MNFGNWIVVSFVLFAAFIGTLVVVCLREDISLVSKDYYQEELVYEDQIQRLNNVAGLKEKPVIRVVDHMVQVEFSQFNTIEHAELEIFCPSNASMDRKFLVKSSDQPVQFFPLDPHQKGMHRAKLQWEMDGKEFYLEEVIYI
jgi:hypothetical protein